MRWTIDIPSEPGWYWSRSRSGSQVFHSCFEIIAAELADPHRGIDVGDLYEPEYTDPVKSWTGTDYEGHEYFGPIQPPV